MKTYCINLDHRPDRWEHAQMMFDRVGWDVERFSAVNEKPGWVGCTKSHLALLEKGKEHKVFMILEDDVEFLPAITIALEDAISQLPINWDMLYLGCSPKEPQVRYSDNLFRVNNAHVTHAILWNHMEDGAIDYILSRKEDIEKIDDFFAEVIQGMFNCFVTYPMCATQSPLFDSDIAKRSDVSTILRNYKKYCR